MTKIWAEQAISIWYWSKENISRLTHVKNEQVREEKPDIQFSQHIGKQFKGMSESKLLITLLINVFRKKVL